jgi:hypothetical protein
MARLGDNGVPDRNKENPTSKCNGKTMRSPALKAAFVEPILTCCIHGVSINDLECEMQKITLISHNNLKKYLFFVVDYRIISHHGQRQVYTIEHDGYDLLDVIMKEKRMMRADMDDLVITLEKDC